LFLLIACATASLTACPEPRSDAIVQTEDVWLAPGGTNSLLVFSEQANTHWIASSDAPAIADVATFGEFVVDDGLLLAFDVTAGRLGDTTRTAPTRRR
jgi:hypothetical protein